MTSSSPFGVHLSHPSPLPEIPPPPGPSLELLTALRSARAAESAAQATWATGLVALLALVATGLATYFAWRALQSWRRAALAEQELSRVIDAHQALHDLEGTIHSARSPWILRDFGEDERQQTPEETAERDRKRSRQFREDLYRLTSGYRRATVGLDEIWGNEFKTAREELEKLTHELALASGYLYEERNSAMQVIPMYWELMGRPRPARDDLPEVTRDMVDGRTASIQRTIDRVRSFHLERLHTYREGLPRPASHGDRRSAF
ncbi:hypothetical protein [Deinococcus planocerae]|uniref:hypothetical protein n=1 Tax=Deinococcus planocerae TaxID=1737569 RepID=UPI000C7ECED3|nr:hypothetical protein [Deinococcus planocerae]